MKKKTITDVGYPLSGEELFVGEVAKMLARADLLQKIYEIPEENMRESCLATLQQADSYLLKQEQGMMLAAIPYGVGEMKFACVLKAGPMNCWIVVTEQSNNSPLRTAVVDMIEGLLSGSVILPDYHL